MCISIFESHSSYDSCGYKTEGLFCSSDDTGGVPSPFSFWIFTVVLTSSSLGACIYLPQWRFTTVLVKGCNDNTCPDSKGCL